MSIREPRALHRARRQAKTLLQALHGSDPAVATAAAARFRSLPFFRESSVERILAARDELRLRDALWAVALEQGHPTWEACLRSGGVPVASTATSTVVTAPWPDGPQEVSPEQRGAAQLALVIASTRSAAEAFRAARRRAPGVRPDTATAVLAAHAPAIDDAIVQAALDASTGAVRALLANPALDRGLLDEILDDCVRRVESGDRDEVQQDLFRLRHAGSAGALAAGSDAGERLLAAFRLAATARAACVADAPRSAAYARSRASSASWCMSDPGSMFAEETAAHHAALNEAIVAGVEAAHGDDGVITTLAADPIFEGLTEAAFALHGLSGKRLVELFRLACAAGPVGPHTARAALRARGATPAVWHLALEAADHAGFALQALVEVPAAMADPSTRALVLKVASAEPSGQRFDGDLRLGALRRLAEQTVGEEHKAVAEAWSSARVRLLR